MMALGSKESSVEFSPTQLYKARTVRPMAGNPELNPDREPLTPVPVREELEYRVDERTEGEGEGEGMTTGRESLLDPEEVTGDVSVSL